MKMGLIQGFCLCAALVVLPVMSPEAAIRPKPLTRISDVQQLNEWYGGGSAADGSIGYLTDDVVIDRKVVLESRDILGGKKKNLVLAAGRIRVVSGGQLVVDDPDLILEGPQNLLEAEGTGSLILKRGDVAPTTIPNAVMVTLKDRCEFILDSGFTGLKAGAVLDQRQAGNIPPPLGDGNHDQTPPEEPPPEETQPEETQPEETQPEETQPEETPDLPGTGDAVPDPSLPCTLKEAKLISISSKSFAIVRVNFQNLPPDTTGIYLYRSYDGISWEKCVYQMPVIGESGDSEVVNMDNFFTSSYVLDDGCIVYKYDTDYRSLFFKAQITTSTKTLDTDMYWLEIPSNIRPGDHFQNEHGEDGSSEGNRGGIQGEGTRTIKPTSPSSDSASQLGNPDSAPVFYSYSNPTAPEVLPTAPLVEQKPEPETPSSGSHAESIETAAAEQEETESAPAEAETSYQELDDDAEAVRSSVFDNSTKSWPGFMRASLTTAFFFIVSYFFYKKIRSS